MHMEIWVSILAANSAPLFFAVKAPCCVPPTITTRECWDLMLGATRRSTIEGMGRNGQGSVQGYPNRQDTLPWSNTSPPLFGSRNDPAKLTLTTCRIYRVGCIDIGQLWLWFNMWHEISKIIHKFLRNENDRFQDDVKRLSIKLNKFKSL